MIVLKSANGVILFEGDYKPAKDWALYYEPDFTAEIGKRTYTKIDFLELRVLYFPVTKATMIKVLQSSNYVHHFTPHGYWDRFHGLHYDLVRVVQVGWGYAIRPRAIYDFVSFDFDGAYRLELGNSVTVNEQAKELIDELLTNAFLRSIEKESA